MTASRLVDTGVARIEVLVEGSGPTVVLLPSSQRDSLHDGDFTAQVAAAGFQVLRPQPRGMGRSTGPLENLTLADLADDVAAVIDQLGGGRAVVAGHAYGHFIARVADLRHPAKVRGVVLLGAGAREIPPGLSQQLDLAADTSQPLEQRVQALRQVMFAPGNDPTPWLGGWHPHLRDAYRRAATQPPKSEWWPVANAPILDLQGAQDPWRPPHTREELRDVLGDRVTVAMVENASHALVTERPQEVAQVMAEWMRGLPA